MEMASGSDHESQEKFDPSSVEQAFSGLEAVVSPIVPEHVRCGSGDLQERLEKMRIPLR